MRCTGLCESTCVFEVMRCAMHNKTGLLQVVLAMLLTQMSVTRAICAACLLQQAHEYSPLHDRTAAWQRWRCSATPSARPRRLPLSRLWRATGAARLGQVLECCSR
jgi:hypothetical protein